MENSVFSSSMAPYSKPNTPHDDEEEEESSWTLYLQDFNNNNNDHHEQHDNSSFYSPFDRSDHHDHHRHRLSIAPKELSNGKKPRRKLIGITVDDDLEDTASSPVHSPKVSCINHEGKGNFTVPKGNKRGVYGQNEKDVMGEDDDNDESYKEESDLKKKGLCLVPMSMITKYIG